MSNYDQVFWLNVTNIVLGVVTVACLLLVGYVAVREIRQRMKAGATVVEDDHTFEVAGLGITMADGGKRVPDDGMLSVTEDGIEDAGERKSSRSKGAGD